MRGLRWPYHKTPRGKPLGVLFLGFCLAAGAQGNCEPPKSAETEVARLEAVHDGDSLRLQDGRRVRLLGVNAPELGGEGEPAEPLAKEARAFVRRLLVEQGRVRLVYDEERRDRFGRVLAHVYNKQGFSLETELLARGLAYHVAIPPNLALADCLADYQDRARRRGLGVWERERVAAADLTAGHSGFQRVQGRVEKVDIQGGTVWLELDGPLVLRVAAEDRPHFDHRSDNGWRAWEGRALTVIGWVIDRYDSRAHDQGFKPLMMRLRTPHAVLTQSLSEDEAGALR